MVTSLATCCLNRMCTVTRACICACQGHPHQINRVCTSPLSEKHKGRTLSLPSRDCIVVCVTCLICDSICICDSIMYIAEPCLNGHPSTADVCGGITDTSESPDHFSVHFNNPSVIY